MTQPPQLPFAFLWPWRIEAKQSAFHPWVTVSHQRHLVTACQLADRQKAITKAYAVRVRPN